MRDIQTMVSWIEYSRLAPWQLKKEPPWQLCDRCSGEGYDGIEEETGNQYICYACYGTGIHP